MTLLDDRSYHHLFVVCCTGLRRNCFPTVRLRPLRSILTHQENVDLLPGKIAHTCQASCTLHRAYSTQSISIRFEIANCRYRRLTLMGNDRPMAICRQGNTQLPDCRLIGGWFALQHNQKHHANNGKHSECLFLTIPELRLPHQKPFAPNIEKCHQPH